MKTDFKTNTLESEGAVLETAQYHIDPNSVVHITQVLRNMYKDPVLAVVREQATNALDAHLMSGNQQPFLVHLPTLEEQWFEIRDFGPGLSKEDSVRFLYGYGASNKRDTNVAVGGFGIGCKCPFSITDQFTYTVYHGGYARVWQCYLDEHDAGQSKLVSEQPSSEPTGLKVTIPVNYSNQKDAFYNAAKEVFEYFPIKPEITPKTEINTPDTPVLSGTLHIQEKNSAERRPVTWHYLGPNRDRTEPIVVVGYTAYTADLDQLESTEGRRLLCGMRIHVPIGFLQLAPNRETLQYSQRTKNLLKAIYKEMTSSAFVDKYLTGGLNEPLKSSESVIARVRAICELRSQLGLNKSFQSAFLKANHFLEHGELEVRYEVFSKHVTVANAYWLRDRSYYRNGYQHYLDIETQGSFLQESSSSSRMAAIENNKVLFLVNAYPTEKDVIRRYVAANMSKILGITNIVLLVCTMADWGALQQQVPWLQDTTLPVEFYDPAACPAVYDVMLFTRTRKAPRSKTGSYSRSSDPCHGVKYVAWTRADTNYPSHAKFSDFWKPVAAADLRKMDKVFYVPMDGFVPYRLPSGVNKREWAPTSFNHVVRGLKTLGAAEFVVGVRLADLDKVKQNPAFINLNDWLKQTVAGELDSGKLTYPIMEREWLAMEKDMATHNRRDGERNTAFQFHLENIHVLTKIGSSKWRNLSKSKLGKFLAKWKPRRPASLGQSLFAILIRLHTINEICEVILGLDRKQFFSGCDLLSTIPDVAYPQMYSLRKERDCQNEFVKDLFEVWNTYPLLAAALESATDQGMVPAVLKRGVRLATDPQLCSYIMKGK